MGAVAGVGREICLERDTLEMIFNVAWLSDKSAFTLGINFCFMVA